ncbi:MAG: 3-deoxy-8-phosphooctulonate synthase [Proteobacteria bacterium]|nr:3-deoxy-8-phosphooctulonate synthase [Pseudomonadota bacterium]
MNAARKPAAVALDDGPIFDNAGPLVVIAGMNVIEDRDTLHLVAKTLTEICRRLGVAFVFKASFDKANRSSIASYRGPGLDAGLELLAEIKQACGTPILTDVHEPAQAAVAAQVADILQIPAFLARQTDLVTAVARTGAAINLKKPQFLAPAEMTHVLRKCHEAGNDRVLICERGTSFGYNNLVVDMLGIDLMKPMAPIVFDVTHALQEPGGLSDRAGGRGEQTAALARAGVAIGIAGLFVEVHADPAKALCDGPSALPLDRFETLLRQVMAVDAAVKR